MKLEPLNLFYTPKNMQELTDWIDSHEPVTRAHLYVLQGMYYNLIVSKYDLTPKEVKHEQP